MPSRSAALPAWPTSAGCKLLCVVCALQYKMMALQGTRRGRGASSFWCSMRPPVRHFGFRLHEMSRKPSVAGLPSTLVGRSSAPVSEPHCVRERQTDCGRLVGQNLWRLESPLKQVGEFASSRKVHPRLCLVVRNVHVCFQETCKVLLHLGGGLAAQLLWRLLSV